MWNEIWYLNENRHRMEDGTQTIPKNSVVGAPAHSPRTQSLLEKSSIKNLDEKLIGLF